MGEKIRDGKENKGVKGNKSREKAEVDFAEPNRKRGPRSKQRHKEDANK